MTGLTEQFISQRTSAHHYRLWYEKLKEKLATLGGELCSGGQERVALK
jgi:hypothetical protein